MFDDIWWSKIYVNLTETQCILCMLCGDIIKKSGGLEVYSFIDYVQNRHTLFKIHNINYNHVIEDRIIL